MQHTSCFFPVTVRWRTDALRTHWIMTLLVPSRPTLFHIVWTVQDVYFTNTFTIADSLFTCSGSSAFLPVGASDEAWCSAHQRCGAVSLRMLAHFTHSLCYNTTGPVEQRHIFMVFLLFCKTACTVFLHRISLNNAYRSGWTLVEGMNQWIGEWTDERTNERTSERMN